MQNTINQITCDACGKNADGTFEYPRGWKNLDLAHNSESTLIDVCSSGCAENGLIKIVREKIYNDQPRASL
jgi:hypothetical protein